MAFFALLWKARTIEKYKLNYEKEKINSIVMGNTRMEQTLSQRWRHYRYDTQKRISSTFKKWYPEGSGVANFFLYLKTDQTFPNFLLKSLMGFVGGIILTYICFMFFVFQLSISLIHSTIMSSIIGVLLTLGLAFSYRIRCLVFLLIPQFFSRVGRYTLTCYALVLILTGPATNTLKNSEVLSESMACSQEQIKSSVHHLNDLVKTPYNSMKDSIKLMIDRFKAIAMRAQQMVVRLNRLVLSIVGLIQYSFTWLQSISNICNAKLGSPYNRCAALLQDGLADCKKAGPDIAMHCNMAYLVQAVCGAAKPFKTFCHVTDFMDDAILANIRKKLKDFTAQVRALFHVEVHTHHSYSFPANSTRSASQVAAGIVTEIRNRTGPLLTWLAWSSCVTSLFLLLIIFRAKYYQHMYETRSRFDNRYITKELQELDLKRQRQGRETVLPLNRRERAKYITTSSFRLVASEKMYLTRSAVFMLITTFKLLIHIVADYSLYWVLMTIRYHGQYQSNLMPGVPDSGAYVTGSGFVARLFRSIVETFSIPLARPAPSLIPCLPDPYPPDFRRYTQIGVLIFLLWFFALFEPYGLRLRHLIMGQYRPERAKARATWLYNHILRTRAGFMKFARRKLHRKYKCPSESSLTFRSWLNDRIPFKFLKCLLGLGENEPHCLLCGITGSSNETDTQLTKCETPRCPGMYCTNCFSDIGQLCTICLTPNDYGDLSDLSLERGSSDDDDSDNEFNGNTNEDTRLLDINHGGGQVTSQGSTNRWNFFMSSLKTRTHNNIALVEACFETRKIHTQLNNGEITNSHIEQKKLQNYKLDFQTDIDKYTFALDYKNDVILDFPKLSLETIAITKSIGTNTERRVSKIRRLKQFVQKLMHRKQLKIQVGLLKPISYYNEGMKDTAINISKKTNRLGYSSNNRTHFYKSVNFQLKSKRIKKRRQNNNITVWTVVKNIVQIIRLFQQCSSELNYVNKNNNENANKGGENKFNDKTPVTPKENENNKKANNMRKESKEQAKKARGEKKKKENNSKKVTDSNKPKKPNKEKCKKISRHRIAGLHSFISNHWRNVKSNIGFRTNRQIDTATFKDKKNHKRRKKRKDDDIKICPENKQKESKARKDSKRTRSYRISAFLADHDWMKRDYKRSDRANIGSTDSCHVTKAPSCRVVPPFFCKNKFVAMVHLDNVPVPLRKAGVKTRGKVDKKFESRKSDSQINLKKKSSFKALERFKLRVNPVIPSPAPSLMNEFINVNLNRKSSINVDSSSICITKRASFYRKFRREAMKLDDCGILDTEELFRNDGYSDFLIPLEFQPKLSETRIDKKIDKKLSLSTPSGLNMIVSNDTGLGMQKSLVSCRFEKVKDRFENAIDSCKDKFSDCTDSCKDKYSSCKEEIGNYKEKIESYKDSCKDKFRHYKARIKYNMKKLKKWTKKIRNKKVRKKTPSEKMYGLASRIRKLCASLIEPSCNKKSRDDVKKRLKKKDRSRKNNKSQGLSQNECNKQRPSINDDRERKPTQNAIDETEPICDETTCIVLKRKKQRKLEEEQNQNMKEKDQSQENDNSQEVSQNECNKQRPSTNEDGEKTLTQNDIDETESICDKMTCKVLNGNKQRELEKPNQSIASKIPLVSNSSAHDESKSVVTRRCKCENYQDVQRKWTHINASECPPMPSIKDRLKKLCSSIFGSGCNEKTCAMNKERQRRINENRLLREKVIEQSTCKNDKVTEQPACRNDKMMQQPVCKNDKVMQQPICKNDKVMQQPKCKNEEVMQQPACKNEKVIEQPVCKNEKVIEYPELMEQSDCKNEKLKKTIVIDDECFKKCSETTKKGFSYIMNKWKGQSKCKKREDAKLKEIQRHIEREKEIERAIQLEQKRHIERELQIQKELGYELIKHRQTQEKLMCDEDIQLIRRNNCVETGTIPGSYPKLRYTECNDAITQDSRAKLRQIGGSVASVAIMCYDGRYEETKLPARNCQNCTRCKPKAYDMDSIDCSCSIDTQMGRMRKDKPTSPAEFSKFQTTATAIGSNCCGCYDGKSLTTNKPCICGKDCYCGDIVPPHRPPSPPRKPSPSRFKNPAVCQRQISTWAQAPLESPIYRRTPTQPGDCCRLCSWNRLQKPGKNNPTIKCECPTQYSRQNISQCVTPMHGSTAQLISPPKPKMHGVHPPDKSQSIDVSLQIPEEPLPSRRTKRMTGETKTKFIYPPDYNGPRNAEWKCSTAQQSPERRTTRQPTIEEQFSPQNSPQAGSPQRHSLRRSPRQRSPLQNPPQRSPPQRSPPQRPSPQRRSPQRHSPRRNSPQQRSPQQQLLYSPTSSQSPGSPLLLIASPSVSMGIPPPLESQRTPSKTLALKNKLSQVTIQEVEPELNLKNYVYHKSDFENKSILADFSAELSLSRNRFRGVAVQAKVAPDAANKIRRGTQPINFSNIKSSEEYTVLVPPAWRRTSTRSKPHSDSVKVLHRRHRGGIDTKQQYINKKDERRTKTKGDKSTAHRGSHYNYCWKKYGKNNYANDKGSSFFINQRLSLESSLCDIVNQSNINDPTIDSECNLVSLSDADEKTDTTFCSLATVHFDMLPPRRRRVRLVTNTNQGTSTEKATVCDAGTLTCDWWSPLVERKGHVLEKSKGYNDIENIRGIVDIKSTRTRDCAMVTEGRFVKFKSGAQLIPAHAFDAEELNIMTPSRYLLESQKYYNELFAYTANPPSPGLHHQTQTQRVHEKEKGRSPIGSRRAYQRKTKRLEESYSPRKVLCSPRKRFTDSTKTSDSSKMRSSIYRSSVKRYYAKLYGNKKAQH